MIDESAFEDGVKKYFDFLVKKQGMALKSVRRSQSKYPQDQAWTASFSRNDLRVELGWNPFEGSLAVLIRYSLDDLSRTDRYVYLEPFVEFLSEGKESPIVPYVRDGLSQSQLLKLMDARNEVFKNGLSPVLEAIAQKLMNYFEFIESATTESIMNYHDWMRRK